MEIIFVAGPPCSGKSTFIKENFPNHKVVDLFDYQKGFITLEKVKQSYEDCCRDLITHIKNGEDVVLEHTMLRALRRKMYIDAVKEITNEGIQMFFFIPSPEALTERMKKRNAFRSEAEVLEYLDMLEIPTPSEGFSRVVICN